MAESSENLDPKEATEAKLCAYLEGELSSGERTEIEQHLAANPQHRQLLVDLAKTREFMRLLPIESAPSDLAEIFQGQVERSMLLDETADRSRSGMNRWPQLAMLAAIVLLVAGLSVVIVVVLRAPRTGKTFTMGMPATMPSGTMPMADRNIEAVAPTAAARITVPAPIAVAAVPQSVAIGGDGGGFAAHSLERAFGAEKLKVEKSDQTNLASAEGVKAKLFTAGYHLPVDQKTVCFVVSSDSPAATVNQVRGFFSRHELAFDDALTGKHEVASVAIAQANVPRAFNAVRANKQLQDAQNNVTGQNQALGFAADNDQEAKNTAGPTSAPSESIYVARDLTQLQLELLSASLATDNLNQTFKRITLTEEPTTKPAEPVPAPAISGAIVKGQILSVTIPQLVGPGIDKTNLAKVAEDGTISLPMIDPLPAAGVLPVDLEKQIAAKYREANLIPAATVTVQIPAATQPTTQAIEKAISTTQPTTAPTVAFTSNTQPSHETSGINVVVLIESSKSNAP